MVHSYQILRYHLRPNATGHHIALCLSGLRTSKNLRSERTGTRIVLTTHVAAIVTLLHTPQTFGMREQTAYKHFTFREVRI